MNRQKLVLVSAFAAIAMCYPFLSIGNRQQTILGFPALFVYLGLSWLVCIVILFWLSQSRTTGKERNDE